MDAVSFDSTELLLQSIGDWVEAVHDRDSRRMLAAYANDTINFDIAPPLRLRGAEFHNPKDVESWFATWAGPIKWEHHELQFHIADDLALAYALVHLTGQRIDGERTDHWLRQTFGLRREFGRWRIIHEHTSVPLYMDGSDLGAVDLKP